MPNVNSPALPRIQTISSRENRWLKRFRAALRGEKPDEGGGVAIEGAKLVAEAVRSNLAIEAILVSASGEHHLESLRFEGNVSAPIFQTSDRLFVSCSGTESAQGIAALVRLREWSFDDLVRGGNVLLVVLVEVQDPGNVGTVIRSAEAFGANGVVATRGTSNPLLPKAMRASAGSALRLPILSGVAPAVLMTQLRVAGVALLAASLSGGTHPDAMDLRRPSAFFIGNEGAGLPGEIERSADALVRIPLAGAVDSLNAGVAAAVLLYEAARQRGH